MIRAVLFDLDDTLFDHQGCARDALTAVHRAHDVLRATPFAVLERAHAGFLEELHGEVMLGRVRLEDARVERFRRLLLAAGADATPDLSNAIASMYRDTYRANRRAMAGAAPLMAAIKRHARIGIVSNNLLEEQQEKLQICGLDIFVDALVVSEEVQVSKPDPAIFHVALDRLAVEPSQAVMIGDSWAADVEGARATGIRAIWFNPNGAPAPEPDLGIQQLKNFEPVDTVARMILEPHRH